MANKLLTGTLPRKTNGNSLFVGALEDASDLRRCKLREGNLLGQITLYPEQDLNETNIFHIADIVLLMFVCRTSY